MEARNRMRVRLTSSRASIRMLACVLLVIAGLSPLVLVKNTYAMSACGILFLCPTPTPTPTPSPIPSPTPVPRPTASPTPVPRSTPSPTPILRLTPSLTPHPTPHLIPSPTATTSVLPTATPTVTSSIGGGTQTQGPNSTNIPGIKGGNAGNQMPGQAEGSGFSSMIKVAVIIFLALLFGLGVGVFILRRMLLPPIHIKLPPSGVSSWSRSCVPNPNSSGGGGMNEQA